VDNERFGDMQAASQWLTDREVEQQEVLNRMQADEVEGTKAWLGHKVEHDMKMSKVGKDSEQWKKALQVDKVEFDSVQKYAETRERKAFEREEEVEEQLKSGSADSTMDMKTSREIHDIRLVITKKLQKQDAKIAMQQARVQSMRGGPGQATEHSILNELVAKRNELLADLKTVDDYATSRKKEADANAKQILQEFETNGGHVDHSASMLTTTALLDAESSLRAEAAATPSGAQQVSKAEAKLMHYEQQREMQAQEHEALVEQGNTEETENVLRQMSEVEIRDTTAVADNKYSDAMDALRKAKEQVANMPDGLEKENYVSELARLKQQAKSAKAKENQLMSYLNDHQNVREQNVERVERAMHDSQRPDVTLHDMPEPLVQDVELSLQHKAMLEENAANAARAAASAALLGPQKAAQESQAKQHEAHHQAYVQDVQAVEGYRQQREQRATKHADELRNLMATAGSQAFNAKLLTLDSNQIVDILRAIEMKMVELKARHTDIKHRQLWRTADEAINDRLKSELRSIKGWLTELEDEHQAITTHHTDRMKQAKKQLVTLTDNMHQNVGMVPASFQQLSPPQRQDIQDALQQRNEQLQMQESRTEAAVASMTGNAVQTEQRKLEEIHAQEQEMQSYQNALFGAPRTPPQRYNNPTSIQIPMQNSQVPLQDPMQSTPASMQNSIQYTPPSVQNPVQNVPTSMQNQNGGPGSQQYQWGAPPTENNNYYQHP